MELRHIYGITDALNKVFQENEMAGANKQDITISVNVSPTTLYGIDREFYKQTHNNSVDGFKPTENVTVNATIDGISFVIMAKEDERSN